MVNHVHSEQDVVDWSFKTSYISIFGTSNELSQPPFIEKQAR